MKILIFGGTGAARDIAHELAALGHDVTTSLAGKTTAPLQPAGTVRSGGFGSALRLQTYIRDNGFDWIIDALHPYAETMSANVATAAEITKVRFVRLARPLWVMPDVATVETYPSAAAAIAGVPRAANVLVTSGHKGLEAIAERDDCTFHVRLIEPPESPLPRHAHVVLDRSPYSLEGELVLMQDLAISHLITKDSGSDATRAKIDAAAELSVVICLIARPVPPPGRWVGSVSEVVSLVQDSVS